MAKLYRPHIPLSVRCKVAGRQLMRDTASVSFASAPDRPLQARLDWMLRMLADQLGCPVEALRLDHDPPLGAREKRPRGLTGKWIYTPDANDPEHLKYRPHGAEYAGSHDVKTRIRGDHGQYSDIALIKRQRRRERKADPATNLKKKRPKWRSAPLGKQGKTRWPKRSFRGKKSTT